MKYNNKKNNKKRNPALIGKPFLPPLKEFQEYLIDIWETRSLTNNGKYHCDLERELCKYLNVEYVSLLANGTLALIVALKALKIKGEVITSPFGFVGTANAISWIGARPVFVDVEPERFNIDADKIESSITKETTAILPVHIYGNPCNTTKIKEIADVYNLKVIYDAAHTFGVTLNGVPVLRFGDLSILSFHATKVFTTFEGGAIICRDKTMKDKIDLIKNFGFLGETDVGITGINAKMNEFQAALGLLQIKYIKKNIRRRKLLAEAYRNRLKGIEGITFFDVIPGVDQSYSYFPIFIDEEKYGKKRDDVYFLLKDNNIYGRRYFYPLISQFPMYQKLKSAKLENTPNAEKAANEAICLPIHPDLDIEDIDKICDILN